MSRNLLRVLVGAFLIYLGVDLGRQIYVDKGNPLFYIPSAIFIIIGVFFCIYYYKQHKKEAEDDNENEKDG